jgi:ABC-2 type transport system permease protein
MAKVSATALVALVVGLVYAAVSFVSVLVSLPIAGAELVASPLEIVGVLGRGVVVVTLLTLIGLAIGVLARSQLLGVIIVIGVLLLELIVQAVVQLITGTLPLWAQALPFALGQAATSTGGAGGIAPLAAIAGLAAVVGVILVIVGVVVRRRDI